ncbi:MAG TPA: hypothetical protein VJ417_14535 [Candidatus Glassbacteria bacterium]|nr:hypothetical protein [Candidatus Glassbacteria bacterium]
MKKVYIILAVTGLVLTVLPALFVFAGLLSWKAHVLLMFAGMLCWFVFAPLWMRDKSD